MYQEKSCSFSFFRIDFVPSNTTLYDSMYMCIWHLNICTRIKKILFHSLNYNINSVIIIIREGPRVDYYRKNNWREHIVRYKRPQTYWPKRCIYKKKKKNILILHYRVIKLCINAIILRKMKMTPMKTYWFRVFWYLVKRTVWYFGWEIESIESNINFLNLHVPFRIPLNVHNPN